MRKRLLALMLAVCMLVSMIPAVSAEPEPLVIKYDISGDMQKLGMTYSAGSAIKNGTATGPALSELTYEATGGFYELKKAYKDLPDGNWVCYYGSTTTSDNCNIGLRQNCQVTFEVYIPVAGTYKMNAIFGTDSEGGKSDYVGTMNVFASAGAYTDSYAISKDDYFGSYSCIGAVDKNCAVLGEGMVMQTESDNFTLKEEEAVLEVAAPGEYVISFRTVSNSANKYRASVAGFELISQTATGQVPMSLKLNDLSDGFASVTAIMSDKSEGSIGDVEVAYESLDPTIATVDATSGEITNIADGEATIKATATINGRVVSDTGIYKSANIVYSGITVKYNVGETINRINSIEKIENTSTGAMKLTYEESGNLFAIKGTDYMNQYNGPLNVRIDSKKASGGLRIRGDGVYVAFEVYVPKAGFYNMDMWRAANSSGTDVEVYLTTPDKWSSTTRGEMVGKYSTYDENTLYNKDYFTNIKDTPARVKNIEIKEPGYYVFTFVGTGGSAVFGFVGSFELNGGEGKVPVGMKLEGLDDDVAKAVAVMSDGSEGELDGIDVTYKSLDTSIAMVDANTGVITAVGEGDVKITATATISGRECVAEGTYTAIKIDGALELRYDIGAGLYELNLSQKIEQSSNGQTGLTYEFSNSFYNYKGAMSESNTNYTNIRIDKTNKSGNIRLRSDNAWIAFEVNVPAAGIYDMNMWHGRNTNGTDTEVYVISADSWTASNFGTGVGAYSSYDEETLYNKDYFNTVKSTPSVVEGIKIKKAGKYVFTFKVPRPADGNTWLYGSVGTFDLIAGDELVTMNAKLKTERNLATLYAHMSDNTLAPFAEDVKITYSSADANIAEVDPATGVITDKAYGKVEITGSCEFNGKTYTSKAMYTALDPNARGVYIDVNLGDALGETGISKKLETKFNVINYDYSNGIYRFYQASTDAHKSGTIQVGPKNIAVRHGYQLALEVLIPEPGIYTMEMWPAINDEVIPINVYMAKGKVSSEDADKIGSYDSKDMSVSYNPGYFNNISKTPYYIENIVVEDPGYYVFNFVGDASMYAGEVNYNYRRGSVGNFKLYSGTDKTLVGGFYSENEDEVMYMSAYPDESEVVYTDPVAKGMTMFNVPIKKLDGTVVETEYDLFELVSSEPDIAVIGEGGIINTIGDGPFEIDAKVVLNGKTYKGTVPMSAYDDTGVVESELVLPSDIYERETLDATLVAIMGSGNRAAVPTSVHIDYSYDPEGIVEIDENGRMTGLAPGTATVTASAFYKGSLVKASADVLCVRHEGKTEPTYYTYKKREIALGNISKYSWARSTRTSTVKSAEKYLLNYEFLYNHIPREGLPRATYAANAADPDYKYCRYCGADIAGAAMGGVGGWIVDPIKEAWKIQCPHCKRTFPSNDFALLYERGLDENGFYDADRARANNAIAVENGEKDALLNTAYTEIANVKTINNGKGLRPGETVEGWGVDDGWGYRPKMEDGTNYKVSTGSDIEIHAYIPYYMKSLWGTYGSAINELANAYLYTGDIKYGRAGAILFDRYADLVHEYDTQIQQQKDGDKLCITANGFIQNGLSDAMNFGPLVKSSDALYPAISDPQVVSFLSKKASEFGLENDKASPERIWDNWRKFYLKLFDGAQNGRLNSNFGVTQGLIALCAVALNEEPETTEMIKWVYAPGNQNAAQVSGGNVLAQLINEVDRDGMGTECGDNYNVIWFANLWGIADALQDYEGEAQMNLFEYPKFPQMFTPYASKVLVSTQLAQVGDSSGVARLTFNGSTESFLNAFKALKENPDTEDIARLIAQYIYVREGYTLKNLKYGIFVENPESVQDELMQYIDTTPDPKSEMIAGYGFSILRDGADWRSVSDTTAVNNQRDVWMYFGAAASHSHNDNMVIGLEAFGLNIAPDNGYPERTGKDPNRAQWHNATISHNTVMINEKDSIKDTEANGVPIHFDDNGQVKLMDVDGKCSYEEAENYRRTLVMMKVDDDISYTVDFFRVTGGEKHTYSFHSQAEHAVPIDGIELTEQKDEDGNWIGTYAYGPDKDGNIVEGVNVPYPVSKNWEDADGNPYLFNEWGADPNTVDAWSYETYFPRGYTWLTKIRRDKTPAQNFAIEFDVEDYRKAIKNTGDIRLRMTQLNSFAPSEVAIVAGLVPRKEENKAFPETFDYVLVHNSKKGDETLDSLYTTVFEPYKDNRYIETIEAAAVEGVDESDPTVRAVKVTHTDGERVDYIIYSANNTKTLRVDNTFEFQGFIGVYSLNKAGEVIYKYVNDGAYIGELQTSRAAYEGVVTDFDDEMNFGDFDNYIDVSIAGETVTEEMLADLAGKWMFIKNDGKENAAYKIESADALSDGTVRLNTGNVTNIRSYVDSYQPELGYVYNVGIGNTFRIPVSESDDSSPIFDEVGELATSAESTIKVTLNAESPLEGKKITYIGEALPRGMTIDSETGEITWKPTSSQSGENHVSVTAKDSDGRESTIHFMITVYGSTTGAGSSSGSAGGGGGGGGGAAPAPSTPSKPAEDDKTEDESKEEEVPTTPSIPSEPTIPSVEENVRFIDLGAHSWAADAINALAEEGIIKGTGEKTFSPAANITRADFALLLVRAFKLTSENTENFADVAETDYFAKELAIARNTGIAGGIGDNKYAPRNTITRQDMMTIVYRALTALEIEFESYDEPQYDDFDAVAEYAKDAVKILIGAGLVNGKSGKIAPTDYTTRAEVAVLIKRILDYTKA